jgi:hypothetical protein
VLDWDRINLENYYSLYITKQIKTERTIKPAVITNMTSVLVRPKIIVYLIQIPNCKAMITVPPSLGLGKEMGKGTASHSADCSRISLISNQGDLCTVHFCLYGLCTIIA